MSASTMIQLSATVRVEDGPVRKRATATKELLDDTVTAKHYRVGSKDSLGKIIKLGQDMDYIDWKSRERVWNVYQETELEEAISPKLEGDLLEKARSKAPMTDEEKQILETGIIRVRRYLHKGVYSSQEQALQEAAKLV